MIYLDGSQLTWMGVTLNFMTGSKILVMVFFFDDCGTKARALNEKICEDALVIWLSSKKAYLIMMIGVEMVLTWSLVDVIILECQNLCSGRLKASADRLLGV